jgi:hypothetical protein
MSLDEGPGFHHEECALGLHRLPANRDRGTEERDGRLEHNGNGAVRNLAAMQHPTRTPVGGFNCAVPINTGGTHWALDAAVLAQQVGRDRHATSSSPLPGDDSFLASDVQARRQRKCHRRRANPPSRRANRCLGSQGNSGGFCFLFGSNVPYTTAYVTSLYKTHSQFVSAWARAVKKDRAAGYLLPADASELLHSAVVSHVAAHAG